MKIAISGTHFSGKTTLGHALVERLDGFSFVDEPYHLLTRDGYEFADIPSVDDFFEQLRVGVDSIVAGTGSLIVDRCPLDFLAYAKSLKDADPVDTREWVAAAKEGLQALDVVLFCPIEVPDRIQIPASEDRKLRAAVDRRLKDMILDDSFGVLTHARVFELRGSFEDRLRQALTYVGGV